MDGCWWARRWGSCLGRRVGDADQAERAVALRVGEVKRELLMGDPIRLLDNERALHLVAAHAFAALVRVDVTDEQVGLYPPREFRMGVENHSAGGELAPAWSKGAGTSDSWSRALRRIGASRFDGGQAPEEPGHPDAQVSGTVVENSGFGPRR